MERRETLSIKKSGKTGPVKEVRLGLGETAQQFFQRTQTQVPAPMSDAHNHLEDQLKEQSALFWPPREPAYMEQPQTHTQKEKNKAFKKKVRQCVVAHAYNPSTGGGGKSTDLHGQPLLPRKFEASLGHVRLCLKKKKKK